jgi:integrase
MKQLIRKTTAKCDLTFRYPSGLSRFGEEDFSGIPLIMHPSGLICWDATDYILYRLKLNPSMARSTLNTCARHISRVIAFIDKERITFGDLNDYQMFQLVKFLQDPKNSMNKKPAGNSQVNKIIQRLFDFLMYLQSTGRTQNGLISTDQNVNAQINIEIRHMSPTANKRVKYYFHPAKLRNKNPRKVSPITTTTIEKLYNSISSFTSNDYIQERWYCLLSILEYTGAREDEISRLTISSVENCMNEIKNGKAPRLKIQTNKGKNHGKSRVIPVPKAAIVELDMFIRTLRKDIIRTSINSGLITVDHGYVFTTNNGANRLTGKRISDHFAEVRNHAKIKNSDATPHMFRHRFISKQVKERLKAFLEQNNNQRSGLEEFVIKKVMVLTGHASEASLWVYVDDALEELSIFKDIESKLIKESDDTANNRKIARLLDKAKSVTSEKDKAIILDELLQLKKI